MKCVNLVLILVVGIFMLGFGSAFEGCVGSFMNSNSHCGIFNGDFDGCSAFNFYQSTCSWFGDDNHCLGGRDFV